MIKSDQRPLYLQVIDRIKSDIENGHYEAGQRLPSEFELSRKLGVSRATLREALRMLEDESVIVRRHGVGTFISEKPLFTSGIEELNSVTDMIKGSQMEPGTVFLSASEALATEEDCRIFKDSSPGEMIVIERVRTADGQPVVYCLDRLPKKLLPDYTSRTEESIFTQLEASGTTISYAHTQIEPVGFHEKISGMLQCAEETSLLALKQMHYDYNEKPVLYSLNYFRADKFKFHVIRKRV
ncbi:GntR family transcriptional regulator [Alteribacter lacisalsi]|jgi:GntR family transcriptional regulator|uniref:GntR family transcriptional regulator n=1 Tax=Alteribacter lacisalsi TaxID=2045244 RepID=A0A2W0HLZ1_9BACI|nr:GntR family transcriptional regulator [Alteribacter lacisalsi]PYZ98072.1 GntR family transcriptional regulator [Alteribacter lacisalsi]